MILNSKLILENPKYWAAKIVDGPSQPENIGQKSTIITLTKGSLIGLILSLIMVYYGREWSKITGRKISDKNQ
jgi:hypothetical protein